MTTAADAIVLTVEDGIARIVLNRGQSGNRIDDDFIAALDEVTLRVSEDDAVRAVVISSTGRRFSVGGDIESMVGERADLPAKIRRWNASLQGSLTRLQRMTAPSVVAVHGTAAGGAVSLLAASDIVVASEAASFVAAYASIGYCADMGGTSALTRRLGLARARRFYLLHERLDAQAAEVAGLADMVVPHEEISAVVDDIAQRWARGPTAAYGEIRRLLQSATDTPYETQMELETQSLARLARTDDAWNGLNAFLQKKPARFTGR